MALFPCCTNVFDKRNKEYLGDMCPMCRAPLTGGLLVANNVVSAISDSNRPAAAAAAAAGEADADADANDVVGDEQALIRTFKSKAANEKHQGSLKAVVSTINTFLTYRPKGARILLAFACDGDERHSTRRTQRTLQQELPKMDTIETVGYNKDSNSVRSFVTESDYNRVLIINTNNTSLSLEGLDLWNAQLIIMDKLNPGYLTPANMVQAIGRIMRPQFEVYIPGSGGGNDAERVRALSGGRSDGYAAKWIVFLERDAEQPQAQEPPPNVEEPDVELARPNDDEEWEQLPPDDLMDVVPQEEWEDAPQEWLENMDPNDHGAGVGIA